jgi:ribosomal protein S18 acetylase RimI-like enzyme
MTPVIIRHATPEDAGLVADLSRKTFYDAFVAGNTAENMDKFMKEQFTRQQLMEEVSDPQSIFLLAIADGEIAGYARLREVPNPPELGNIPAIEIARIYSITQAIGKGIGSALMQQCITVAKEKKKQAIWLGVWEHNQRAIAFYTKWGFQRFSEHTFLLGDDPQTDWMMKLEL